MDKRKPCFVKGIHIVDNVLAFKLGKEWANKWKNLAVFMKLDFEKVYNQINHTYLWETMKAIAIYAKFTELAKCLLRNAQSKIHVRRRMHKLIPYRKGVRQGCPLAIVIILLTKTRSYNQLNKYLLHQLFMDDYELQLKPTKEI